MKTYTAHFRTDAEFATREIKAATPDQALKKARELYDRDPLDLKFQSHYEALSVNGIAILDADRNERAVWLDEDLRLRLGAPDLLEALRFCDMTFADLQASKRKGYIQQAIRLTRAALAKAKGGAA